MSSHYKSAIEILGVGALYFALAQFGFIFALPTSNISLVWLPSGLAMAAVVLIGYRAAGGILLAAFLANYYVIADAAAPTSLPTALAVGMGNAGESLLAGALFSRFLGPVGLGAKGSQVRRFVCRLGIYSPSSALGGLAVDRRQRDSARDSAKHDGLVGR